MSIDDEKLMAFADGELSASDRIEIEAALEQDPQLRAKLEAHRTMRARLSAAFDGALSEPVPAALNAAAQQPHHASIIDLAARRTVKWSVREWSAMAASVALGLVVGVGAVQQSPPMIATAETGIIARGPLARALNTQLAAEAAGAVRIGISFRNRDGDYCRTFDLTRDAASGVACREGDAWVIPLMSGSSTGGEVRPAGASPELLNAVDAMISGDPLGADAERNARDAGWRSR
jgi:hypothetical protein